MNRRFKLTIVTFSTILVVLLLLGAAVGRNSSDDAYRHLAVYTEVLSRIKSEYVEEPDVKSVTLGAMNGLLEAIDPFASYLNADQYKQYLKSLETKKSTPGMILSRKFGYVGIVSVLPGSSAAKAGLSTGDIVEVINGIATRDMPLAYAEMLLAGEPGSSIEISVLRLRNPEPQKITLVRQPVRYGAIATRIQAEGVGLIQVPALDAGKATDVANAIVALEKQGAKKLIIDLRNNAAGKPEEGIALASLFLDKGLITYLQGQKMTRQDFPAEASRVVTRNPLVLITNRGTAGAAEIAAAALLDGKRAEIVGERTYGDAAVRRPITMDDGSAVILSVAKYYAPSGKAIQDTGVSPTAPVAEIEPAGDDDENTPEAPAPGADKPGEDLPLKRAVEILTTGKTPQAGSSAATGQRERVNPDRPLTVKTPESK